MDIKNFQLLTEILKTDIDEKELQVKGASVIKAENVDYLNTKSQNEIYPVKKQKNREEIVAHIDKATQNKEAPKIELIKLGDRIESIIVYCKCGEVFKINIDY